VKDVSLGVVLSEFPQLERKAAVFAREILWIALERENAPAEDIGGKAKWEVV